MDTLTNILNAKGTIFFHYAFSGLFIPCVLFIIPLVLAYLFSKHHHVFGIILRKNFLILTSLLFGLSFLLYLEGKERCYSFANCESDYIWSTGESIRNFVETQGYYPAYKDYKSRLKTHGIPVCRNVPYRWIKKRYSLETPYLMIVWDGKPHGFIFKWRNVVIGEKGKVSVTKIPEGKFQKLLKQQEGTEKSK